MLYTYTFERFLTVSSIYLWIIQATNGQPGPIHVRNSKDKNYDAHPYLNSSLPSSSTCQQEFIDFIHNTSQEPTTEPTDEILAGLSNQPQHSMESPHDSFPEDTSNLKYCVTNKIEYSLFYLSPAPILEEYAAKSDLSESYLGLDDNGYAAITFKDLNSGEYNFPKLEFCVNYTNYLYGRPVNSLKWDNMYVPLNSGFIHGAVTKAQMPWVMLTFGPKNISDYKPYRLHSGTSKTKFNIYLVHGSSEKFTFCTVNNNYVLLVRQSLSSGCFQSKLKIVSLLKEEDDL